MAIQRYYYSVFFQCHSLQPVKRTQRVMSAKPEAGVDLVAEVRAMLAGEFKRQSDEIEILQVVGVNDSSQVWPPVVRNQEAEKPEAEKPEAGVDLVNQGEGTAAAIQSATPSPGWTPADQPLAELPTIEAASMYRKEQLIELAATLKLEIGDPSQIKYPDLRKIVLATLQQKLTGQAAA